MTTINRIRFFDTKSSLVRCYGVSQRITVTKKNGEHTYYLDEAEKLQKGKDDFAASNAVATTIAELLKVNGIFWVLVRAFEINVKIEVAFDWQDVHEDVIRIIKANLYPNVQVDVQDATQKRKDEAAA